MKLWQGPYSIQPNFLGTGTPGSFSLLAKRAFHREDHPRTSSSPAFVVPGSDWVCLASARRGDSGKPAVGLISCLQTSGCAGCSLEKGPAASDPKRTCLLSPSFLTNSFDYSLASTAISAHLFGVQRALTQPLATRERQNFFPDKAGCWREAGGCLENLPL